MVNPANEERAVELANKLAKTTLKYCEKGLPKVYLNFEACLTDWWMDLPWENEAREIAVRHILKNHQDMLDAVEKTFGFDLEAYLKNEFVRGVMLS